ncbi:MAG: hypothetical protein REJ50_14465 [Bordetella sp.]|nr:hypothetical protein [Bordetella sp.]
MEWIGAIEMLKAVHRRVAGIFSAASEASVNDALPQVERQSALRNYRQCALPAYAEALNASAYETHAPPRRAFSAARVLKAQVPCAHKPRIRATKCFAPCLTH